MTNLKDMFITTSKFNIEIIQIGLEQQTPFWPRILSSTIFNYESYITKWQVIYVISAFNVSRFNWKGNETMKVFFAPVSFYFRFIFSLELHCLLASYSLMTTTFLAILLKSKTF